MGEQKEKLLNDRSGNIKNGMEYPLADPESGWCGGIFAVLALIIILVCIIGG